MRSQWEQIAQHYSSTLNISVEELVGAFDVVYNALGAPWITEQQDKKERPGRTPSDAHTLYRELTSQAPTSLVHVYELAKYLLAFLSDPALPAVIQDLREEGKYESGFSELAMAFRWQAAGAVVSLQPPTPTGIADFEAKAHDAHYIVEASVFPADPVRDVRVRWANVAARVVSKHVKSGVPVTARVVLRPAPAGVNAVGLLRSGLKEACRSFEACSNNKTSYEGEFFSIELETAEGVLDPSEPGWDIIMSYGFVNAQGRSPSQYYTVLENETEKVELVRLFMRYPPRPGSPIDRIVKKLHKELAQLSGVSRKLVILEVSSLGKAILLAMREQIQAAVIAEMRRSRKLVGVWIVQRGYSDGERFGYFGYYVVNPESIYQIPNSFVERLQEVEQNLALLPSPPRNTDPIR